MANTGDKVPEDRLKPESVAMVFAARVTVVVYVCVVVPSCAVTTVLIVLLPTFKLMLPLLLPDVTVVPLTLTVAFAFRVVGLTVILVVALETEAV